MSGIKNRLVVNGSLYPGLCQVIFHYYQSANVFNPQGRLNENNYNISTGGSARDSFFAFKRSSDRVRAL